MKGMTQAFETDNKDVSRVIISDKDVSMTVFVSNS